MQVTYSYTFHFHHIHVAVRLLPQLTLCSLHSWCLHWEGHAIASQKTVQGHLHFSSSLTDFTPTICKKNNTVMNNIQLPLQGHVFLQQLYQLFTKTERVTTATDH